MSTRHVLRLCTMQNTVSGNKEYTVALCDRLLDENDPSSAVYDVIAVYGPIIRPGQNDHIIAEGVTRAEADRKYDSTLRSKCDKKGYVQVAKNEFAIFQKFKLNFEPRVKPVERVAITLAAPRRGAFFFAAA